MRIKEALSGIRFKTWVYFVTFSICILGLLMLFQVVLFEPYYRNTKMHDIKTVVNNIAENIDDSETISTLTVNNDGCLVIVNSDSSVAAVDAIGVSCLLYKDSKVETQYLDSLKTSENGELSYLAEVDSTQEMLIYGKTFENENGEKFYVLFNTPLQPLKSTIAIIRGQYTYIALIVLSLTLILSIIFARQITKPIVKMTDEAHKLSEGNYGEVHFDESGSFLEMNNLSRSLNNSAKELDKINELRSDLLANVSHDIRTPLTMIQAYAEMIRDITGNDAEKRNENLTVILQECEYLDKLVNDMSEMTKLQSGTTKLNISDFDLCAVINNTADKFRTISKKEGIKIQIEAEPELIAHADKFKITEVIYNFMGNAIKHYGNDKLVIVKAFTISKEKLRVEVIDHGPGISAETLSHIWERYYKMDMKYQRAHSGTGLGLAISKAILDQHQAVYGVNSKVGEGSTFFFEIESAIPK